MNSPTIIGDVVFGDLNSPVAVCTLGSRSLLADLAGRSEIAVAGRVFTENVGIERMVQNLIGLQQARFLIVCGRETRHQVGQTILALHSNGLDGQGRVIGSTAPEPVMPNLTTLQLQTFQTRITVVDLIGTVDPTEILARARALAVESVAQPSESVARSSEETSRMDPEVVQVTRAPAAAWEYDPIGYFLVFVNRNGGTIRVEHYTQAHVLITIYEGRRADDLCHAILVREAVSVMAHAAYLGRELAKAEAALSLGLDYDQDRPLRHAAGRGEKAFERAEEISGDSSGNRGAP